MSLYIQVFFFIYIYKKIEGYCRTIQVLVLPKRSEKG